MTVVQAALTDCSATHELSVHAGSVHSGLIAHNDHSTAERGHGQSYHCDYSNDQGLEMGV